MWEPWGITEPFLFERLQKLGLRPWPEVRALAREATGHLALGRRILVAAALVVYLGAVVLTQSLLVAIAGGVVVVALRLLSIELLLLDRMTLVGDMLLEMHAHTDLLLREAFRIVDDRLPPQKPDPRVDG